MGGWLQTEKKNGKKVRVESGKTWGKGSKSLSNKKRRKKFMSRRKGKLVYDVENSLESGIGVE